MSAGDVRPGGTVPLLGTVGLCVCGVVAGLFVVPGWFWAKIAATAISTKNMSVAVLRIK
jgi:hypothetical protein